MIECHIYRLHLTMYAVDLLYIVKIMSLNVSRVERFYYNNNYTLPLILYYSNTYVCAIMKQLLLYIIGNIILHIKEQQQYRRKASVTGLL